MFQIDIVAHGSHSFYSFHVILHHISLMQAKGGLSPNVSFKFDFVAYVYTIGYIFTIATPFCLIECSNQQTEQEMTFQRIFQ